MDQQSNKHGFLNAIIFKDQQSNIRGFFNTTIQWIGNITGLAGQGLEILLSIFSNDINMTYLDYIQIDHIIRLYMRHKIFFGYEEMCLKYQI